MLISLQVKNMALIREEEVTLEPGLTILTGETGAGKSIIIGAVNVALGAGKFSDYVTAGTDSALCELVFETGNPKVLDKLAEMDIPAEEGQIVITRKYQKGRSISRVNGESVPINFVRELAGDLIDIHGQHEHQSLLHPRYHLELLDRHAQEELTDPMEAYTMLYEQYRSLNRELEEAVTDKKEQERELDLARYEVKEIQEAHLSPGEDEELELQFRRMENGQKIAEALSVVQQLVGGEGAGDSLDRAARQMSSVTTYDPALEQLDTQLNQVEDLLGDFARELSDYLDDFAYDEQAFYETGQRLDQINHLKGRYGTTIEQILTYAQKQQALCEKLENYEAYLEELHRRKREIDQQLKIKAEEISAIRHSHAKQLEKEITEALVDLNFLDVHFNIHFDRMTQPGPSGCDEVNFLISTNPGMPLRPLQDTASGGELSRIMLAIKAVMADQDAVDTLIFDEIDTGISGRTAQKVSEKMAVIAQKHQVICITHLAQIAAMADHHYVITKQTDEDMTATRIHPLGEEESAQELSRIIGGVSITEAVMDSAREMRKMAMEYKRERL